MKNQNEFKFGVLRQFGTENFSFNATVYSDNVTLSEKEISDQVAMFSKAIRKQFIEVQEREIGEKELLASASERRTVEMKKLDLALQDEMKAKKDATKTMYEAEKLSNKLSKK